MPGRIKAPSRFQLARKQALGIPHPPEQAFSPPPRPVLLPRAAGFLIAPDLAGKVVPMLGRPYLTEDARYGLIYRLHSKWMRPWVGEDAAKTNHQLRKYAASKIYKRDGLEAAAYFLGDTVATAAKFYTTWLGGSGKLDGADVAGHG